MTTRKDSDKLTLSQPTLPCVNCGDNLSEKSASVNAFQSFINNTPARIFVEEAIQEIFRLNDEPDFKCGDEFVLCVHCCLLLSQMFGLFKLFEARQNPDGLLASCCSGFRGHENVIKVDVTEHYDDDDEARVDDELDPSSCLTVEAVDYDNFESAEEMEGVEESSEDPNDGALTPEIPEQDQPDAWKICADGKQLIFKCADCSKSFKQAVQLRTHRVSAHNSKEAYKCAVCKNVFASEITFRHHLFQHWRVAINKFNITCSTCHRKFPNRVALVKHKSLMHSRPPKKKLNKITKPKKKPQSTRCRTCNENFDSTFLLRKHRLVAHIRSRQSTSRSLDQAELQTGRDMEAEGETGQAKAQRDEEVVDVQESDDPDFDPGADSNNSSSESDSEDDDNTCKTKHQSKKRRPSSPEDELTCTNSNTEPLQKLKFECTDCNLEYDCTAEYGRHRKEKHGDVDRPFKCHLCPLTYRTSGVLRNHVLYKHSDINLPKCNDCDRTFPTHRKYWYHMQDKHETAVVTTSGNRTLPATYKKIIFMCIQCNILEFQNEDAYAEHLQKIHKRGALKCPQCPKYYSDRDGLKRHLETHDKEPFACDVCDATFRYSWDWKRHMTYEHVEQPAMALDDDDDPPSGSQENNDAEITKDPNTGLFCCPLCPSVAFEQKRDCHFHLASVHPELMPFQCEICNKKYKSMQSLKKHRKNIHQTGKCEHCDFVSSFQNVHFHMKRVHSSKTNETKKQLDAEAEPIVEADEEVKEPNPFKCADCDKSFEAIRLLVRHRAKDHPDQEKLKCPQCLVVYATADKLRDHILKHDEGNDWPCGECPLRFTARYHRNKHLEEAHAIKKTIDDWMPLPPAKTLQYLSGEFSQTENSKLKKIHRFKCPECEEEFKLPSSLGNHRMIVHGVDQSQRFKCYHCEKILPSLNYYYEHTKRHEGKKYLCSECGKCFSTRGDLTAHYGLMHDEAAGARLRANGKRWREKKKQQKQAGTSVSTVAENTNDELDMDLMFNLN